MERDLDGRGAATDALSNQGDTRREPKRPATEPDAEGPPDRDEARPVVTWSQPEWDNNDYARDFEWLGQPRERVVDSEPYEVSKARIEHANVGWEGFPKEQTMDKPSVGRIVHYVAYGTPGGEFPAGVCRATVITEVASLKMGAETNIVIDPEGNVTTVSICVLNPSGLFFNRGIQYDEKKAPGTWHWPERV